MQKSPSDPRTSAKLSGAISHIEQQRANTAIIVATKWTKSPKLKRQKRDGQEIAKIAERRSARFAAAVQREQENKERQETVALSFFLLVLSSMFGTIKEVI